MGQATLLREQEAGVWDRCCWRMKSCIFKARFPFSLEFFQGVMYKLFSPHHPACVDTTPVRRKREHPALLKGPARRFIKQTLGHRGKGCLVSPALRSTRGNIRINQRTCTFYSEGHELNMPSFPHLSDRFLDDSSRERMVTGKCSLKSLVTLEMPEKWG